MEQVACNVPSAAGFLLRVLRIGFYLVVVLAAVRTGTILASVPNLVIPQLLSVVGQLLALTGILVLSKYAAQSGRLKEFLVGAFPRHLVNAYVLGSLTLVVTAAVLDGAAGFPSARRVSVFFLFSLAYSLGPLFLVEDVYITPLYWKEKNREFKTELLGWLFLISGLCLQLTAAIRELLDPS